MSLTKVTTFDAFDPGVEYCARAMFVDGVLRMAVLCSSIEGVNRYNLDVCVVERVVTRGAESTDKYKAQDLLDLSWAGGQIAGQYRHPVKQSPHQVPKKIWQNRIRNALKPSELALLPKLKKEQLHVLDAIGVGLKYLGRI